VPHGLQNRRDRPSRSGGFDSRPPPLPEGSRSVKALGLGVPASTVLVGNLTDDPELRYTPNGVAVTNFRLAVTPRVKDPDGSWRNGETSFIPVNVWRDIAENVAESDIRKGARVLVTGRLRTRTWETEQGDKRSMTELDADEVAPSLRFHQVHEIVKADRTRGPAGRERQAPSRADDLDEPPFSNDGQRLGEASPGW